MRFFVLLSLGAVFFAPSFANQADLYRFVPDKITEQHRVIDAHKRLNLAMRNPEYLLTHWVELPTSPSRHGKQILKLTIREAILLALRYNPNIQSAELDRIIQRYQLRLAQNEFELQYALAGTAMATDANYSGVGHGRTKSYLATPEFSLKNMLGTEAELKMDNNVAVDGNYNPLLNFSFKQPLLRGFGRAANESHLLDAIDSEWLNKLNLQQAVIDQITGVIGAYRALVLSGNNLQTQQRQLVEAKKSFEVNQKKIASGQLEPTANIQQSYQIESLNLMVEQAENEFKTAALNLLQTIGLSPSLHLAVPNDVSLDNIKIPDYKQAVMDALKHNTQYLALVTGMRADQRAYKLAKNQQLWQLDVTANVQAGTVTDVKSSTSGLQNVYSGNNVTESAGVTLTIPLHDLNRRSGLISAKIKLEKDRLNLIAARRALITTIKSAITTIKSLAKRYELAKHQVELATQSYKLEKKKQAAGISSSLDVNNTQNQLIQAEMGLIGAKIAFLNQLSELQRLLGTTLDDWNIRLRYTG